MGLNTVCKEELRALKVHTEIMSDKSMTRLKLKKVNYVFGSRDNIVQVDRFREPSRFPEITIIRARITSYEIGEGAICVQYLVVCVFC